MLQGFNAAMKTIADRSGLTITGLQADDGVICRLWVGFSRARNAQRDWRRPLMLVARARRRDRRDRDELRSHVRRLGGPFDPGM